MNLLDEVKQSGRLKGIAMDVYEIIFNQQGLTGGEIWRRYKAKNPKTKLSRNDTQKRVNDLVNWGAVTAGDKVTCSVTGKSCKSWKVTGKLPERTNPATAKEDFEKSMAPIMAQARERRLKADIVDKVRDSLKRSSGHLIELDNLRQHQDKWYAGDKQTRQKRKDALEFILNTLDFLLTTKEEQ